MALDIGPLQSSPGIGVGPLQAAGGSSTIDGTGFGIPSRQAFGTNGAVLHPGDQSIFGAGRSIPSRQAFGIGGATAGGNDLVGGRAIQSGQAFGRGALTYSSLIKGSYGIPSQQSFGNGALTTKVFTIFVSGADVTPRMQVNTLDINNYISQISTAAFTLETQDLTSPLLVYEVGQPVLIYHGSTRIFGGTIDSAYTTFTGVSSTKGPNMVRITCSDFSEILDRRYVAGNYNQTGSIFDLVSIVTDIVGTYLAADGITYDDSDGNNESLANFGTVTFDWITARQAFTQLATLVNWSFSVDYYGVLRFYPLSTGSGLAPFNINDNDGNWMSNPVMTVQETRQNYRNRQGVRSSSASTALWTDTFATADPGPYPQSPQPPDGTRTAFITLYGIPTTPYVFVNGTQERVIDLTQVGSAAPDSWDWYWIPPQGFAPANGVFQNPANAPLSSSDVLVVQYQSPVSPIIWVECADQIAIRAAIEGNSGVYEDVQDVQGITDPSELQAYAQGLLNLYGCISGMPREVIYYTLRAGLFAGMLQTIKTTNPYNAGTAPYMIVQVEIKETDGAILVYTVTADSGYFQTNPASFWGTIVNRGQTPQPANRNTYTWSLSPTIPGVANNGLQSGNVLPIQVTLASSEVPLYFTITYPTTLAASGPNVEMEINNAGFGQQMTLPVNPGSYTVYFATQAFPQGSTLTPLFQGGNSGIKDGVLTLVTSVIRN